jgi:hypothetical protein
MACYRVKARRCGLSVESLETRDLLAVSFTTLAHGLPVRVELMPVASGIEGAWRFPASAGTEGVSATRGPVIVDFGGVEEGPDQWTFQGRVIGEDVVGLDVHFGGLSSLEGTSAVVEDDGWFHLTIQLQLNECGTATAQTQDAFGNPSNIARALVCPGSSEDRSEDHPHRSEAWPALGNVERTHPQSITEPLSMSQPGALNNSESSNSRRRNPSTPALSGQQGRRAVPAAVHAFELVTDAFGL